VVLGVSTESGSDRIRKSHSVSELPPDPVANAPGTDTGWQPPAIISPGQKYPQIAHVCACRSGDDGVAQRLKKRKRIAASQEIISIEVDGLGALDGGAVDYGPSRATVAVDSISAGAEGHEFIVAVRAQHREPQSRFEISPASPIALDATGELAAGDETDWRAVRVLRAKLSQAIHKLRASFIDLLIGNIVRRLNEVTMRFS